MSGGFSLVVSTRGRVAELERLFGSLARQSDADFEVILVDQNGDERLAPVVARYETEFPIRRIRSEPGLSRGRNAGLRIASRPFVAFPDDDCEYPADLLSGVLRLFAEHPTVSALCGRAADPEGRDAAGRFDRRSGLVTKRNLWRRHISFTMFFRAEAIATVGDFDERLGLGAGTSWGAGEETDYLCRLLRTGAQVLYSPALCVLHGQIAMDGSEGALGRATSYGCAMGYLLRRHKFPLQLVAYLQLRPLGGAAVDLLRGDLGSARFRWRTFCGRVAGYLAPSRHAHTRNWRFSLADRWRASPSRSRGAAGR